MSLQPYLRLLNTKWHKGSSKAKPHEAMALQKVLYAEHCSPIYREVEQLRRKLHTCPWVYIHDSLMIQGHRCMFPFLSCCASIELLFLRWLAFETFLLCQSYQLRLAPLVLVRIGETSLHVTSSEGQLRPSIVVYMKHLFMPK
jgi:hypothetical protein